MSAPLTFKQLDGKWHSEVNPRFVVEMETTYGVDHEVLIDRINTLTPQERLILSINSWREFAKKNDIDTAAYTKDTLNHEEEVMADLRAVGFTD